MTLTESWEELEVPIKEIQGLLNEYEIEILGADGYVPVVEFVDKGMYDEYILETDINSVRVNLDHLFETDYGWMRADDMLDKPNLRVLHESGNFIDVKKIYKTGNIIPIVDIVIDHENHRYFANGISSHNTNAGKSMVMCHMAASFVTAGKNVLYISMEMSEEVTSARVEANLLNIDISSVKSMSKEKYLERIGKIQSKTHGRFIVKEFPTSGAHVGHFKALVNELKLKKNFKPDVIFVDYLNICLSQRVKGTNANSYTIVKSVAEELRGFAVELDIPVITATQSVRQANGSSDLSMTDVSESMGLAHTVDMLLGLIRTPELDEQNQLMFKLLKSRFVDAASFGAFLVGVERSKMKLFDLEKSAQDGIMQPIGQRNQPKVSSITQDSSNFNGSSFKGIDTSGFNFG